MGTHKTAVFGIFADRRSVERAILALERKGFSPADISVLMGEGAADGEGGLATENATKAPEGAVVGASTGAAIIGTFGWLAGMGALAIPGLGPLLAAGPLMAALAGVGVGGAIGGLAGALIGLGIPEYEAHRYEGVIRRGGILVSVHAVDPRHTHDAKLVLDGMGARDVGAVGEVTDTPVAIDEDVDLGRGL